MSTVPSSSTQQASSSLVRGAGWMILFKLAERSIGLVSTLILARILVPADFGLVAMAAAVVALIELMSAFGFDVALIHRSDADRRHYDTAWTFSVLFGLATAVILLLLTIPAATFYREPRLTAILPALALGALFQSFENVGTVGFRKELAFHREFFFLVAKKLAGFVITVTLALVLRNYWALIAGIVSAKAVGVLLSYRLHPYRPRFNLSAATDLFHFSKWLLLSNLVGFLQNRGTDFVLGRTTGAHGLGVYSIAFEIASLVYTELVAPLNRAAFPVYARLASNVAIVRTEFLKVIGVIALVALPLGTGLACVADPLVRLLLGEKWLEAIPLVQIISVYGVVNALQSNTSAVLIALGKPRILTVVSALVLLVAFPALVYASSRFGPVGAAAVFCAIAIFAAPLIHCVFYRIVHMHAIDHLSVLVRPIVGSVLMAVAIYALRQFLSTLPTIHPSVDLLVCVLLGASSYIGVVIVMWVARGRPAGAEASVLDFLDTMLHREE